MAICITYSGCQSHSCAIGDLFSMCLFVIHRSLVGLEDAQMAQEPVALESMIFENDQGFFGGL